MFKVRSCSFTSREAYPDLLQRISRWLRDQKVQVKSATRLRRRHQPGGRSRSRPRCRWRFWPRSFTGGVGEGRVTLRDLKPSPGTTEVAHRGLPKARDSSKAARVFVEELTRQQSRASNRR